MKAFRKLYFEEKKVRLSIEKKLRIIQRIHNLQCNEIDLAWDRIEKAKRRMDELYQRLMNAGAI